jgi:hypothetical protein
LSLELFVQFVPTLPPTTQFFDLYSIADENAYRNKVRDDSGEGRAHNQDHHPTFGPSGLEAGELDEQIDSIGGAVANVREYCE